MTADKPQLHLRLRNYLIENKIPLIFIDFDRSLIYEHYDGRGFSEGYQILVLREPDPCTKEIESSQWQYPAKKMLLVYNCSSDKISLIPLSFSTKLPGRDITYGFRFYDYCSLKICENHIMITAIGQDLDGSNQCCNIALFTDAGVLVSVWKLSNANGYKTAIRNFHELAPGHWVANFEIYEKIQYKPAVKMLCLLSTKEIEANQLSLKAKVFPKIGSLLDSKTSEIGSWFSEEVNNLSEFFVLASCCQCCIYRLDPQLSKNSLSHYDKIADIALALGKSSIGYMDVALSDEGITINFHGRGKGDLLKFGSFHLSLRKEN